MDLFDQKTNEIMTDIRGDPVLANESVQMHAHQFKFDEIEIKEYPEMYKLYKSQFVNDIFSFAEKKTNPIISMRLERNSAKSCNIDCDGCQPSHSCTKSCAASRAGEQS